jgi:hypothetical protein
MTVNNLTSLSRLPRQGLCVAQPPARAGQQHCGEIREHDGPSEAAPQPVRRVVGTGAAVGAGDGHGSTLPS